MKTISLDLRERIVATCDEGGATQLAVADRFGVSLAMVKKLLAQRRRTGDIAPLRRRTRPFKITEAHRLKLTRLIRKQPDITLEELRYALNVQCSLPAIHYVLKSMDLSYRDSATRRQARTLQRTGNTRTLSAVAA